MSKRNSKKENSESSSPVRFGENNSNSLAIMNPLTTGNDISRGDRRRRENRDYTYYQGTNIIQQEPPRSGRNVDKALFVEIEPKAMVIPCGVPKIELNLVESKLCDETTEDEEGFMPFQDNIAINLNEECTCFTEGKYLIYGSVLQYYIPVEIDSDEENEENENDDNIRGKDGYNPTPPNPTNVPYDILDGNNGITTPSNSVRNSTIDVDDDGSNNNSINDNVGDIILDPMLDEAPPVDLPIIPIKIPKSLLDKENHGEEDNLSVVLTFEINKVNSVSNTSLNSNEIMSINAAMECELNSYMSLQEEQQQQPQLQSIPPYPPYLPRTTLVNLPPPRLPAPSNPMDIPLPMNGVPPPPPHIPSPHLPMSSYNLPMTFPYTKILPKPYMPQPPPPPPPTLHLLHSQQQQQQQIPPPQQSQYNQQQRQLPHPPSQQQRQQLPLIPTQQSQYIQQPQPPPTPPPTPQQRQMPLMPQEYNNYLPTPSRYNPNYPINMYYDEPPPPPPQQQLPINTQLPQYSRSYVPLPRIRNPYKNNTKQMKTNEINNKNKSDEMKEVNEMNKSKDSNEMNDKRDENISNDSDEKNDNQLMLLVEAAESENNLMNEEKKKEENEEEMDVEIERRELEPSSSSSSSKSSDSKSIENSESPASSSSPLQEPATPPSAAISPQPPSPEPAATETITPHYDTGYYPQKSSYNKYIGYMTHMPIQVEKNTSEKEKEKPIKRHKETTNSPNKRMDLRKDNNSKNINDLESDEPLSRSGSNNSSRSISPLKDRSSPQHRQILPQPPLPFIQRQYQQQQQQLPPLQSYQCSYRVSPPLPPQSYSSLPQQSQAQSTAGMNNQEIPIQTPYRISFQNARPLHEGGEKRNPLPYPQLDHQPQSPSPQQQQQSQQHKTRQIQKQQSQQQQRSQSPYNINHDKNNENQQSQYMYQAPPSQQIPPPPSTQQQQQQYLNYYQPPPPPPPPSFHSPQNIHYYPRQVVYSMHPQAPPPQYSQYPQMPPPPPYYYRSISPYSMQGPPPPPPPPHYVMQPDYYPEPPIQPMPPMSPMPQMQHYMPQPYMSYRQPPPPPPNI